MKFQKKNIYFILLISCSIFIASLLWPLINFSTTNSDIVGVYSQNNYNSLNDILRYLTFILIPVSTYLIWKSFFEKKNLKEFFLNFIIFDKEIYTQKKIYFVQISIFIFLILEFFSLNFSINELDIYHEGQRLSSAFKSKLDGSLWSGSYVTVGIIFETLGTKFIWEFFDKESIGLMRILDLFYVLFTKFLLIFLSLEISKNLKISFFSQTLFFIASSLIFLKTIDYNSQSVDLISFREIPIILTLILFIRSFNNNSNFNSSYLVIGFLSIFCFFWSIDRGVVQNLLIIFIFIGLILNKKFLDFFTLFFSILFFWILFYFILKDEFYFFINNTLSIIYEMSNIHGIIHPLPFSDDKNSSRATKNLLSILFSLIISLSLFFKNDKKFTHKFKIILFSISIISFFSYIYALGRSDGPHLKQTFGFSIIFFTTYIFYYLLYFSENKFNLYFSKNFNKFLFVLPFLLIFFLSLNIKFNEIPNFTKKFNEYINFEDKKFLSIEDKEFLNLTSKVANKQKCIQLYTNDVALLYLLKLPSCSKFYFIWSIGSLKNQKEMIKEMHNTNLIISNGRTDHWGIPLNIKYPLLSSYINKNYPYKMLIGERKLNFNYKY